MRQVVATTATVATVLLLAACGGGSEAARSAAPATSLPPSAAKPDTALFPASKGPGGADRVTTGPVSIVIPGSYEQRGKPSRQTKATTTTFVSTRKQGRQRVAIAVTWSNGTAGKSAQQEAKAFRGRLLDVDHVKDLRTVQVDWPGLATAYQFDYTDRNVSPAVHAMALLGETSNGRFVSVTAASPPELLEPLQVKAICGSMRVPGGSSGA